MCPVCTVAVAGGLGISRFLGIDDIISGFWVGALILSTSFWIIRWTKKRYDKRWLDILVIIAMYLLTLLPLNRMGGGKRLIIGTALGSLIFLLGIWTDKRIRVVKGNQLIKYQKVVIPILFLVIPSIIAYFLLK